MYTLLLESLAERYQRLRLQGRLTTTEGDATTLAKEGLLAYRLLNDVLSIGLLSLATHIYRIGVGAVEATEVATLQEYHKA